MRVFVIAVALIGMLLAFSAQAQNIEYTVEPIVGYERVQKLIPTPHSTDRLVYGARATAGIPYISAEAEYTHSRDTEDYPLTPQTITETEDKARIGLRSSINLASTVYFFLRAGAQAKQVRREIVGSGASDSTDPIRYNPYAGAGFRFRLGHRFSFSADATAVFRNFPNMAENDYMFTAGFVVSLP